MCRKKISAALDRKLGKFARYRAFRTDCGFRTFVLTLGGALLNAAFAAFNCAAAVKYSSVWYAAFASYYLILSVQRTLTALSCRAADRKHADNGQELERAKYKIYFANGAIFVPLDIALGAVITIMIIMQKPSETGEIAAIATATYTCCKTVMAIINLLKAKSVSDPGIKTIRNIGLVDALVSLISLEVTLTSTFSKDGDDLSALMALSGLAVCAFTIGLGIYMMIKAAKKLREENDGQEI